MTAEVAGRTFLTAGCILAATAVGAGAFGAHMLKSMLEPPMLAVYETAARYQMFHAFGLIAVGISITLFDDRRLAPAGWLFATGIVLFCGSLYGIALAGLKWLGPVTPLGGLALIGGWIVFGWRIWRGTESSRTS